MDGEVPDRVDGEPPRVQGYALPYYTRDGCDTEYLISNPGPLPVVGSPNVYGPECRPIAEPMRVDVGPNCTQSVRLRAIVPEHAGHAILDVNRAVLVGQLYYRKEGETLVGNALAGRSALLGRPDAAPATYDFTYRTMPFGADTLEATLFVSSPNSLTLVGEVKAYGEKCELVARHRVHVRPGCTED